MTQFIGIDLGSSSVKVSVLEGGSGKCLSSAHSPGEEMSIDAPELGWAEQDPEVWYQNVIETVRICLSSENVDPEKIEAIGISYQMHGLVMVDKDQKVIRPSIIWCDSRAVDIGEKAFRAIGGTYCLDNLLNSPANFTASKLSWIKINEPENYERIHKIMLPGDYIAMRLTGNISTTPSGLSEGILWDFRGDKISSRVLDHFGISEDLMPDVLPTFFNQGKITANAAFELGLNSDTIVSYRAGDQVNNALSLNVLSPGEIAATSGTSGVIYGVSDKVLSDRWLRVNIFAHVNHSKDNPKLGVLACINGAGIMNAWVRNNMGANFSFDEANQLAAEIDPGSNGLKVITFGNGAERLFSNKEIGASFYNLNLNTHRVGHMFRAVHEAVAYSFRYAIDIMRNMGMRVDIIRAGKANMFQSPIFCKVLATITGASINLYNTDGSMGAARGAGYGSGYYKELEEAFNNLEIVEVVDPDKDLEKLYMDLYEDWVSELESLLLRK